MAAELPVPAVNAIETLSSMAIHLKSDVGDFQPFGVLVDKKGEASYYSISTEDKDYDNQEFFELLICSLKGETNDLDYEFAGICIDMTAVSENEESQDVFGFYVERRTKEYWFVVQPYSKSQDNLVEVGDCVANNAISLLDLF